jgi:MEMO1 family protein
MLRPMNLAQSGWYPGTKDACKKEIEKLIDENIYIEGKNPVSAIVPHAGWFFCGNLSVNCIRVLKEKNGIIKNVFIFGGHLSEVNLAVMETFDYAQTPFGNLKNNRDVINFLKDDDKIQTVDFLNDNTIEILLPIVYHFFGSDITVTAIYLPPHMKIKELIEKLYKNFGTQSVFIGSTDLTHYGPNYGFTHHDKELEPVDWVKKINDKNYIDMLLEMKDKEALEYALKNKSACSSGAALGALLSAKQAGIKQGNIIGYNTSYEKHKNSSFVGYVGILY